MDFRSDCRDCLSLTITLQLPVACADHAGGSRLGGAWAAHDAPTQPRSSRDTLEREFDHAIIQDRAPTRSPGWPFNRLEYERLSALRERVRRTGHCRGHFRGQDFG
jgi:hypothetical protein